MVIDKQTFEVLKNFANINQRMVFLPGEYLYTSTMPLRTIRARAKITSPVEREFAIGDLPRFLGVLRLFLEPEITLREKSLRISEASKNIGAGANSQKVVEYTYAAPGLIPTPPTADVEFLADFDFYLDGSMLKGLRDAATALGLKNTVVIGDGKNIYLEVRDMADSTCDTYKVLVGTTSRRFFFVLHNDNMLMMPASYTVEGTFKKIIRFRTPELEYLLPAEAKGTVVP